MNRQAEQPGTASPGVDVHDLTVDFRQRAGLGRRGATLRAVRGVSFQLYPGETLGLAGESGSGKSTVARALMRVETPSDGSVVVDGRDVTSLRGSQLKAFRRRMQMVYQDPYDSLDPRMKIGSTVAEGLAVHGVRAADRPYRVRELLEQVGLPHHYVSRYPHQLSGGQRQRVSIARALAVNPSFLICDEAVSALDVSIRAQVLNLLKDLQDELHLSYLFISHDLSTLRFVADRVAVMYLGALVEVGHRDQIFDSPQHPYTRALLAAVPQPVTDRSERGRRLRAQGEPPSPTAPPSGCPFHPRCPQAEAMCQRETPLLRRTENGQLAACHFAPEPAEEVSG